MAKILFVADRHLLSAYLESEAFFPAYFRGLAAAEAERRYLEYREIVHTCGDVVLQYAREHGPWDLSIDLGDMTSGWQRKGVTGGDVLPLVKGWVTDLRSISHDHWVSFGDHDLGVSGGGGVLTGNALLQCDEICSLYWHRPIGGVHFIGICAALASRSVTGDVQIYRDRQKMFVADMLHFIGGAPWVLCTHMLDIGLLADVIRPHQTSMLACLYGHRHAPWFGRVTKAWGSMQPDSFRNTLMHKSELCPSVAPLWWRGGGFIEAEAENGELLLTVRHVPMPHRLARSIYDMPFSSLSRSLWAVERNQMRKRWRNFRNSR